MDSLTHTLLGVALAKAGLARRYGRGTTLALVLASNLPDVDGPFAYATGIESFLVRRVFTHSVFTVPLLAAAAAGLWRLAIRRLAWRSLFGLFLLGASVHVSFDLVNSFGVLLFSPLSRVRPELAWVFIVDLVIWALLAAPIVLSVVPWFRARSETIWRLSLSAIAVYVLLCGLARARAVRILEETMASGGEPPDFAYVFPEALGPHRFRGVVRYGEEVRLYLLHVGSGEVESRGAVATQLGDPRVEAARTSPAGRAIDAFFKAPVWRLVPGSDAVEVYDLRFRSFVLEWRRTPFVYRLRERDGELDGWSVTPAASPPRAGEWGPPDRPSPRGGRRRLAGRPARRGGRRPSERGCSRPRAWRPAPSKPRGRARP